MYCVFLDIGVNPCGTRAVEYDEAFMYLFKNIKVKQIDKHNT